MRVSTLGTNSRQMAWTERQMMTTGNHSDFETAFEPEERPGAVVPALQPAAGRAGHRYTPAPAVLVAILIVLTLVTWAALSSSRGPEPQVPGAAPPASASTPSAPPSPISAATASPEGTPTPPSAGSATPTPDPSSTAGNPAGGSAAASLESLPVKGGAPMSGYSREIFGQPWADTDRNGCDTRNDILARDLRDEVLKPGTRGCVVLAGRLAEPYSGKTVLFQRGFGSSSLVQIDHVVALADAWKTGAQGWNAGERLRFANDPLVLLSVDGALNQQKRASDAASWLPPNKAYRCTYIARQIAIKRKYRLWVKPAEKSAMERVLTSCPQQPLESED